jgi:hypothetical protein
MCAIGMLCMSHTIDLGVDYKTNTNFPQTATPVFAHPDTRTLLWFKDATLRCRPT